jgi:hypothetical protein
MKATEILKRFDAFLSKEESKEVKLAQMKLENGTVIEAEEFKEGEAVFIVTEDEKVPLPIGEYEVEGGSILVVTEEGIIGGAKEEVAEEEEVEVEAEAETKEPKKVVESTVKETHFEEEVKEEEVKEEVEAGYATKEELGAAIDEIKAMIEDLKNPKKEEEEEMQEAEELKAELSKPASKPLKHNPDANKTVKKQKFAKQQGGTMSRVLNRISNK